MAVRCFGDKATAYQSKSGPRRPVILYHETPVKSVFYSSNFLSEFKDHQNTTDISKKIMTNPSMISML